MGRCGSGYDYENLLVRCQQARFFNVCVFLYKKRKDFPRILQYYIAGMDAAAASHSVSATEDSSLFDFICSAIADATAAGQSNTVQQLRNAVLDRLPDLVRADPVMTAKVIVQHFSRDNDKSAQHNTARTAPNSTASQSALGWRTDRETDGSTG